MPVCAWLFVWRAREIQNVIRLAGLYDVPECDCTHTHTDRHRHTTDPHTHTLTL